MSVGPASSPLFTLSPVVHCAFPPLFTHVCGPVVHSASPLCLHICVDSFTAAIGIDPDFKEAYVNYGQLLRDHGDGSGAVAMFKRAMGNDENYTHSHYLLGQCYYGMGMVREAHGAYTRGLKCFGSERGSTSPGDELARSISDPACFLNMIGVCCIALGDYRAALNALGKIKGHKNTDDRTTTSAKLSGLYFKEMTLVYWSICEEEMSTVR